MRILICVDDTDDLTKETSTGKIADAIAQAAAEEGARLIRGVTRHQLLLSDQIDYTSHNSSMCMELETELPLPRLQSTAEAVLRRSMSAASDPGLCFCRPDQLRDADRLLAFGRRAQHEVLTQREAYDTAAAIGGTELKAYGGDGSGVIGALAGCGLRLSGSDGTMRGGKGSEFAGKTLTVREWKQTKMGIEQVVDFDGNLLADDVPVSVDERLKLAYLDHRVTLVARSCDGALIACTKNDLYHGDRRIHHWQKPCDAFTVDNDLEECWSEGEAACWNCLYRRWTEDGYRCVRDGGAAADI
ncbi:MAG: hypothetical protein ACOX41_09380 [Anaerovoracaceae bacterium]|jgi:hypothetical protein